MANIAVYSYPKGEIFNSTAQLTAQARQTERTGVVSGCNTAAQASPDMTVKVDAGIVIIAGARKTVAGNNVNITSADATHPRIDVIYVDTNGTAQVHTGTAAAIAPSGETPWKKFTSPFPAESIPSGVILALVHVGATVTTITSANIKSIACYATSPRRQIVVIIDGGGYEIEDGIALWIPVDYACTIKSCTMVADQSGSIVVDIWKSAYADVPAENAESITASAPPTITTAVKSQDNTLTGWTTSISAGDWLYYNVDSCTTIPRVTIDLEVESA